MYQILYAKENYIILGIYFVLLFIKQIYISEICFMIK